MHVYLTELWSGLSLCLSDRLWFDELISLWASVQNLPSWEVVSSFIYWLDQLVLWKTLLVLYFDS